LNSKKRGKLFAVLMVCLIAYGFGSSISLLASDTISLEVPSVLAAEQQQISTIGDPNFEPVWLKQQVIKNITNNTTINNNINTNNSTFVRRNNSSN
jgi:hypothetical protein